MASIESCAYHDSAGGPNWLHKFGVKLASNRVDYAGFAESSGL
jgi:hypothetical protein